MNFEKYKEPIEEEPSRAGIEAAKRTLLEAEQKYAKERRTLDARRREQSVKMLSQFKSDLFDEYDVSGLKADQAYQIAWDDSHSEGLKQVANRFATLIELIKP